MAGRRQQFRLRKGHEFKQVLAGRHLACGSLRVYWRPTTLGYPRLGVVATKKVFRNAVARNYFKRILYEAFWHSKLHAFSLDVLVIGKRRLERGQLLAVRDCFNRLPVDNPNLSSDL